MQKIDAFVLDELKQIAQRYKVNYDWVVMEYRTQLDKTGGDHKAAMAAVVAAIQKGAGKSMQSIRRKYMPPENQRPKELWYIIGQERRGPDNEPRFHWNGSTMAPGFPPKKMGPWYFPSKAEAERIAQQEAKKRVSLRAEIEKYLRMPAGPEKNKFYPKGWEWFVEKVSQYDIDKILGEKSMKNTSTKALPDELPDNADVPPADDWSQEPFGSQSLRHYHQKLMGDMAETEEHLKLLDHEPTKKLLTKMQEHRADMLDDIEATHAKHYKDLPQLEDAESAAHEEGEGEGELEEEAEDKDDEGMEADSETQEEPTPDEAIEGMQAEPDNTDTTKSLKRFKRKSADDEDKKDKRLKKSAEDDETEKKGHRCGCSKGMEDEKEEKDYPIDEPVPEQAIEDTNLPDSAKDFEMDERDKKGVGEAAGYLKDLAAPQSVHDDESRMKAYHYAKTLEGIGQIQDSASEPAAVAGAEEDIDNEGAKSQIPGDLDYWAEEANEPEHVKMCKDASGFLKALSTVRDFGDVHREKAAHWHKVLDEMTGAGQEEVKDDSEVPDMASPEESAEKTYEPGEMNEKDMDEDDKEEKRLKKKAADDKDKEEKKLKKKSADDEIKEDEVKKLAATNNRMKSHLGALNKILASLNGSLQN